MKKDNHVAVLMGGFNSEREVSLSSGEAVYEALIELGYKVTKVDFDRNIARNLMEIKPDVVFNAMHGKYGEDGRVQGLLDILNIPYTHSGILASAISMDKILSSNICSSLGINFPQSVIIKKGQDSKNQDIIFNQIGKPFVLKPVNEGSSVGVEIILEDMFFNVEDIKWHFGDEMIVEKYIAGAEIQVAIMNDKALGAIEVRPKKLFYDYECKYTKGMTDYILPAEISDDKYTEALDLALKCHKEIGCSGISRVDFILNNKGNDADNQFYFLEINTHPGFTSTSLVPKIAKHSGVSFGDLVQYLILSAKVHG